MPYGHPISDFPKNTRDEVVNLKGETGNPTIHADSPDTVSGTRSSITITSGKRTMRITNVGTVDCYYGDVTVTAANGSPLYSNGESVTFENVKDNFTVHIITAAGTTELRICEF